MVSLGRIVFQCVSGSVSVGVGGEGHVLSHLGCRGLNKDNDPKGPQGP